MSEIAHSTETAPSPTAEMMDLLHPAEAAVPREYPHGAVSPIPAESPVRPMQPTKFASGYQRIKSRARDKIEQQCRVIKDLNREIISLKARLEGAEQECDEADATIARLEAFNAQLVADANRWRGR